MCRVYHTGKGKLITVLRDTGAAQTILQKEDGLVGHLCTIVFSAECISGMRYRSRVFKSKYMTMDIVE